MAYYATITAFPLLCRLYIKTIFSIKKTKKDVAIPAKRNAKGPIKSLRVRTLFSAEAFSKLSS